MRTNALLLAAAATLCLQACSIDGIKLRNETQVSLIPYPVVTTPPPPHRESNPAGAIAPGANGKIDPTGFNPLFYSAQPVALTVANGLHIQFTSAGDEPQAVMARVFHHVVQPGQEGSDPAQQPVLLHEVFQEVPGGNILITVATDDQTNGGWSVTITK